MKWFFKLLSATLVFMGITWGVVSLLIQLLQSSNAPIVAEKSGLSADSVDALLAQAFETHDILWSPEAANVSVEMDVAEALRQELSALGIESYLVPIDNTMHWRIYDRDALRYDWRIESVAPPPNTTLAIELDDTHSYTVAILLHRTPFQLITPLVQSDWPLNFVLSPTSPFGLRNAHDAAQRWHEIILDTRGLDEFSLQDLPFTSGIWTDTSVPLPYGMTLVKPNMVHALDLADPAPFTKEHRLYGIDMTQFRIEDILQWLNKLPDNVTLVRLSYWDIHPE